jgi:hypothetical protein
MQASRVQAVFWTGCNLSDLAHLYIGRALIPAHAEKTELEHLHFLLSMEFMKPKNNHWW